MQEHTPAPHRQHLPHSIPFGVETDSAVFFLTINCLERGVDVLCCEQVANSIFDAADHYLRTGMWGPRLLLLMPDHIHLITSLNLRERPMRNIVEPWKGWLRKQTQIAWQRGFFDHRLRNEEEMRTKADYVLMNPVRKGLVQSPEEWPWQRTWSR